MPNLDNFLEAYGHLNVCCKIFFPVVNGMYYSTLTVKIAMVQMQGIEMTRCFIMHCLGL